MYSRMPSDGVPQVVKMTERISIISIVRRISGA